MLNGHATVLATDWDVDNKSQEIMIMDTPDTTDVNTSVEEGVDESLFLYSNIQQEASTNHFFVWQATDPSNHSVIADDVLMMMQDEEDDHLPLTPIAGRLTLEQELEDSARYLFDGDNGGRDDDDDDNSFFTANSGSDPHQFWRDPAFATDQEQQHTSYLPVGQRYQAMVDKLAESMKKSQETRKSLRMKTTETAEYNRWSSVIGTLSSIEKSSLQLHQYLKTKPRQAAAIS